MHSPKSFRREVSRQGPGARAWLEGGLRLVGLLHHHACAVRLTPVTLYSRRVSRVTIPKQFRGQGRGW
eukprot:scaffold57600_cov59-Phaeocystis_antarctica.AAC.1